ncbi:(2Fe-2S)-binding protein [Selenihalanaerobacter shriftii]|uniref:Carbon-monoxide dehydrogenase small subunit n=1 Tax=Selenihalanaerobacter shriftii TaxID=142842 RepID=A0A1T4JK40_9FIRM|nr:(2Fe-2S)-binding protein [Selenihalanaerobacter shriftii]SJZ30521.1 carbon-monoxide dehydrogenase small subunit [Selenihalanaerobacter shriftii]
MKMQIQFTLNGEKVEAEVSVNMTLLDLIRDEFKLTGTKKGCDEGDCGACTVLMNGKPVSSCMILAIDASGKDIETIEGLKGDDGELHPIQQAFVEIGAIQCGFCTPGMILTAKSLLNNNLEPTETEVRQAISGNLCRCTGYEKIVEAILQASEYLREEGM